MGKDDERPSCSPAEDIFIDPARIGPHAEAGALCGGRDLCGRFRLKEGIAAGQRQTVQVTGREDVFDEALRIGLRPAAPVPGLRILTGPAMVRAALEKRTYRTPGPLTDECRSFPAIRTFTALPPSL